jgi:hypothetical protein
MGKFDDKGILSPNKFRKNNDKAPTHTGIIDIGRDTLKQLLVNMKDNGEAKLEIAGWRKTDKPDMLSLKVSIPREREEGNRGGGSRGRARDDDDDRGSRNSRGRDRDDEYESRGERSSTRRARDDDYEDNEPPFEDRRSSRRSNRRDDDEGDEL